MVEQNTYVWFLWASRFSLILLRFFFLHSFLEGELQALRKELQELKEETEKQQEAAAAKSLRLLEQEQLVTKLQDDMQNVAAAASSREFELFVQEKNQVPFEARLSPLAVR